MEVALVCLGLSNTFWTKLDVQLRANGFQVRSLGTKAGLAEFIPGSPAIPAIPTKWRKGSSSQPRSTRAGGWDDVSLDELPQNTAHIIYIYIYVYIYTYIYICV